MNKSDAGKIKSKIYLPVIYVDENGEVFNSKQLQDYEYKKGEQEQHENRDQFGTIRVETIRRIYKVQRRPTQGRLFD